MDIIPSFDLMGGKLVRLRRGDFDLKKVYPEDPLELAKKLEASGIRRLHIVDLDGARNGKLSNLDVLAKIGAHTSLQIDYGGGLRSIPSLKQVWDAGADLFSVGSVAVLAPDEFSAWVEKFGPDRFLVGADVRDRKIAVHGWVRQTEMDLFEFLRNMMALGISQVSVTDISRDGELGGAAVELYTEILETFPGLHLVASGGVGSVADLEALAAIGCGGAIVGTAFLEGTIPLEYFRVYSKV
ncbi:MAG: 1-(5-phosphoribosyl)-5-[(5-phosphoribosylamino)methylideneamino] imidazole-4-carboxamide isomerase [Saprospiraceae bacterium]|nr:1-(5-phosphoribosyl)-5-[(5-phosphoribosylamino)methylideneamino] imidazole-4-carboxamide isomerase [Saprospiraceae bacterium]